MKCIYCGATLGPGEYCINCGADLTLPRRIVRISNLLYNQALEKAQGGATEPSDYDDWQAWDGISDKYQYGAIVRHTGKLWFSNYKGQNVWEPGAPGTETLWVEYKEE